MRQSTYEDEVFDIIRRMTHDISAILQWSGAGAERIQMLCDMCSFMRNTGKLSIIRR